MWSSGRGEKKRKEEKKVKEGGREGLVAWRFVCWRVEKLGHFRSTRPGEIGRSAGIKKKATPFSRLSANSLPPSPHDPKPRPVIKHSSSLLDGDSRASFYIKHVHY